MRHLRFILPLTIFVFAAWAPELQAAPHIPHSDGEVVEKLPLSPNDPALRELRALTTQLKTDVSNLPLALRVARGYLERGRKGGDPRFVGYAQAALSPWWDTEYPPTEVALLRAAARQRVHQFGPALDDLAHVISADPRNAQARLMRATILQVTGAYDAARAECEALPERRFGVVHIACIANVEGATGKLFKSYSLLKEAVEESPGSTPAIRVWVLTTLAEMAVRTNRPDAAEAHFRAALAIDPDDAYLLAAFADFLLDCQRPAEVEILLQGRERIDPLLLRLAIAAKMLSLDSLQQRLAQLSERFDASRMRGEAVHLREEARFRLTLLDDPARALELARENWRVQKEPADLRILVEAGLRSGDDIEIDSARAWLKQTRLEDFQIEKLLASAAHPN